MEEKANKEILFHIIKIPILIFFLSVYLLIHIKDLFHGFAYLALFFLACISMIIGIIKTIKIIIEIETNTLKEKKEYKTMKENLKKIFYKILTFSYTLISLLGFAFVKIISPTKFFAFLFTTLILIGLYWMLQPN